MSVQWLLAPLLVRLLGRSKPDFRLHFKLNTMFADEPSVKRGSFFNWGAAEASAAPEAADSTEGDMSTIAAGEPLTPRPSKSDERLQRVRRLQMAQFMDQLRRTSLQQVCLRERRLIARKSVTREIRLDAWCVNACTVLRTLRSLLQVEHVLRAVIFQTPAALHAMHHSAVLHADWFGAVAWPQVQRGEGSVSGTASPPESRQQSFTAPARGRGPLRVGSFGRYACPVQPLHSV